MPAPALRDLQALFWGALHGDPAPDLEAVVVSTPALSGRDRLDVYASMYFWRLRDVLAEDFERTAETLGAERFAATVRAYVAAHPSEHPSVRHFGGRFATFLAAHPPAGAPAWLADLARLEWARVEVFDAADAPCLGLGHLRGLGAEEWPGLRLRPIPALAVLESPWPLHAIWRDGGDPRPVPTALRVWRQDGKVYHSAMDSLEGQAFAVCRAGGTFGDVCESLSHLETGAAAAEAGSLLARWIEDGLIAAAQQESAAPS